MRCKSVLLAVVAGVLLAGASRGEAQDWPQWRGPNRDGKATGFKPPATWPQELTKKWQVTVGTGVATPALVGDKLFVFSREDDQEVLRCLETAAGKELWQDKYQANPATGGAAGFSGPRCSPTVADGKVVTLGVSGTLSCVDAATGKVAWRKDDFRGSVPQFYTSSSPIVIDKLCIAQVGGRSGGGVIAYDLASGEEKWKWLGEGPAYASPVLMDVGDTQAVVSVTAGKLVALKPADGTVLWDVRYSQGRYNAASPIALGQTLIYAGPNRGITSETLDKQGDTLVGKERWKNDDTTVAFNTPVVREGLIFGLSNQDRLFCIDAETGKTSWSAPLAGMSGGGGRSGYGSVVDGGDVLAALSPAGQLVFFEPQAKEFKQLASYKVADGNTYAYPILAGDGVYIKDRVNMTLWKFE